MNHMPAPIVLFVYNRPEHTRKTLEALKANTLADNSSLYIYADGLKEGSTKEQEQSLLETRAIIQEQQWCKNVEIIISDHNKGLAQSIVEGVTNTVNQYGRVIVLEDDIVTAPHFLEFMNEALTLYEKEERVMHIGGYTPQAFPKRDAFLPTEETFLIQFMTCWGWATWKDAWSKLNLDTAYLLEEIKKENRFKRFNLDGSITFHKQLEWNLEGKMKTWAIKWFTTIFLEDGLCLQPSRSIVRNIGFDGTGENSGELYDNVYAIEEFPTPISVKFLPIKESKEGRAYFKAFYQYANKKSLKRFLRKVKNKVKQILGVEIHD
ncbi:glycosyltransferase family A protein [Algivirga pacifica]|uniref:Glycosyltransferase n=1 Tax=Algivirga pacifica TaxID=1162670 RepID=A0ABP9DL46_9BACT